jgi:hypothetical protein
VASQLNRLAPSVSFGWFEGLWFLLLFPFVLWTLTAGVAFLLGHRGGLGLLLRSAATGAAPIVAAAHLAKAVAKVFSWGGYLPLALKEPAGLATFREIADGVMLAPAPLMDLSPIGWLMLLGLAAIGWRSWRWLHEAAAEALPAARAGFAVVLAFFLLALATWPWF